MSGATVSPESNEARLTRLETREEARTEQLRVLSPLVSQYAVLEERLANLGGDLDEGLTAVRSEIAAVRSEIAETARRIEKRFAADDDAKALIAKQRRQDRVTLLVAAVGLVGVFFTTLIPLLLGGPH